MTAILYLIVLGLGLFTLVYLITTDPRDKQITEGLDDLIQKQDELNERLDRIDQRLDQIDQRLVQLHLEFERLGENIHDKIDDHQKCIRYLLQQNSLKEYENILQESSTTTSKKAKKAKK